MNSKLSRRLLAAAASLQETRDELFNCSRECVTEGVVNGWQVAEELFALAKSTDAIRQQIVLSVSTPPEETSAHSVLEERSAKNTRTKTTRKRKTDYPLFAVRNNSLVKTGLSRDRRTEYEHLIPKTECDKVVARLITLSDSVKEFTTEDVQSALDCPLYHTYTVLSLLKHLKMLNLPSRGRYGFASRKTFKVDVTAAWSSLKQDR